MLNARAVLPLALLCLVAASPSPSAPDPAAQVVVTANGTPVSESQVLEAADVRINAQAEQERQRGLIYDESSRKNTREFLRDDVLHMLIERILIADQLKADHLEIAEAAVQERFAKEAADRSQTFDQAKLSIAQQGQTVQSVCDGLRQTMGVERLFQAHAADQKELTDAEAREFYNANPNYFAQPELRRVSRILIRLPGDADQPTKDAALKRAQEAMKRIRAGDDFAAVAATCSDDDATKARGGDRGWSPRGWVPSPDADPFGNVAFALKNSGDTSDITRTQDGWDIIKLTGLKPARLSPFEEVESQIRRDSRYRKIGDFWNTYAADLWKKARIDWSPSELARQAANEKREHEFAQKMEAEAAQKPQPTP